MKTSVISQAFRDRYLSNPDDPDAFEGPGRGVRRSRGLSRTDRRSGDRDHARDACWSCAAPGPIGYPGAAEVVNMRPPAHLIVDGVHELPCIGDGRQSGTSGSPSILNASPEAAAGGSLALLRTGDRVRIDLKQSRLDVLLSDDELAARRAELEAAGGYALSGVADPLAGDPALGGRPARRRHDPRGRRSLPADRPDRGIPRDNH
jgi:dihydroxy-acid dehydratase